MSNISDGLIISATLLGPILAVQAQKWIELGRERSGRKRYVFDCLMATRRARLSAEHVRALNMIDLAFYGTRFLGQLRRSKSEQAVLDAWKEYLDHLSEIPQNPNSELVGVRHDELSLNVLEKIATDLEYSFDRVSLRKGAYSPQAHGDIEAEQNALRRAALVVLSGGSPVRVVLQEDSSESNDDQGGGVGG